MKFLFNILILLVLCLGCRKDQEPESAINEVGQLAAERDTLPLEADRGRQLWLYSATALYDPRQGVPGIDLDLMEVLSSATRQQRFKTWGVINDPLCKPGNRFSFGWDICPGDQGPEGVWANLGKRTYRDPACELNEVELSAKERKIRGDPCLLQFGTSAGVVGLRKFPNPRFKKGSADAAPFLVGMSCAFCHAGYKNPDVPRNPNDPSADQLHGIAGNPYLTISPWPSAHRPVRALTRKDFTHALGAFNDCRNCKPKAAAAARFQDVLAYAKSYSDDSLAETVGMRPNELIQTPAIGGKSLWEKGQKIFHEQCATCHGESGKKAKATIPVQYCEQTLPAHVRPFVGRPVGLKNIWSRTPLLTVGSIGRLYCGPSSGRNCVERDLAVASRLSRFDTAMAELLTPTSRRRGPFLTTRPKKIKTELGEATLKAGLPYNMIATLDEEAFGKAMAPASKLSFQEKRQLFETKLQRFGKDRRFLLKSLAPYTKCQPVYDQGHEFGANLISADKKALISYLKTL